MKTIQHNYKVNNQSGYPFLSIALEKNEIDLAIQSFTSKRLGVMNIVAYSSCFQDDVRLLLQDNRLIIQAGIDQEIDKPLKVHLLDKENRFLLRTGFLSIKTSEIRLDNKFNYEINSYYLEKNKIIHIELVYSPNNLIHTKVLA